MIEDTTNEIEQQLVDLSTYLRLAIRKGSASIIRSHLEPDHNKHAVLCKAAEYGHLNIVKLLVEEFDANIRAYGDYVLEISMMNDHADIYGYFNEIVGKEEQGNQVNPGDERTFDFDEEDEVQELLELLDEEEEEEEIQPEEKQQVDIDWKRALLDAIQINRHPLDDLADDSNELEKSFATLEKIVEIYPEDDGLFYVQSYMKIFEPLTPDMTTEDAEGICGFFKTRRDAPQFVRSRLKRYLQSIEHKDNYPIMEEKSKTLHSINLSRLQQFKSDHPEYYKLAEEIIYSHYERELNGETVLYLARDGKQPDNPNNDMVTWYDEASLRRHHRNLERGPHVPYIAKILRAPSQKPKITIKDEAIFDELQESFPNFKEVIRFYKAQFRLLEETNKYRVGPILLLGLPGIGKSLFVKRLAEALKTNMTYVDISSATTGRLLSGASSTWSDAKQGKIVEAMLDSSTVNPIVVLDELEKPVREDIDPKAPLYQLLEENTAKVFSDEFIDHPIDCSGVIYIACANDLEGIPGPLLTRFKIFDIPSPTREERSSICNKIYQEATGNSTLFNPHLSDDLTDRLIGKSLREAKHYINDAVANALLEYTKDELKEMKLNGDVIKVEPRHMNLPVSQENKKKFGF
ncbi:AAA family ATPase [Burkholderia stagnalis]|uniref:AAA family ATPase n=1 Tax=Burkholderia stagnalis TaxID=1503054 RepID=A0A6L3N651_9BURK|nr:AAA family ATPase [Burkholderia stagnalis]KAB0640687.1 AAA family ATPase [Burkholderia stagnalis]VWB06536.1 ATPase AAA [Burkholderia stagnalis]